MGLRSTAIPCIRFHGLLVTGERARLVVNPPLRRGNSRDYVRS